MVLPVGCIDAGILNGVASMNHLTIAHIDSHMADIGRIIGALKENDVTRLGIGWADRRRDVVNPLCCQTEWVKT